MRHGFSRRQIRLSRWSLKKKKKQAWNHLVFNVSSRISVAKLAALCWSWWRKKSPHKTSSLLVHSSHAQWYKATAHPKQLVTITSMFAFFSLMWGMISCCKERFLRFWGFSGSEVSPEEGQVECLSYNFTEFTARCSEGRISLAAFRTSGYKGSCIPQGPVLCWCQQIRRKYCFDYSVFH